MSKCAMRPSVARAGATFGVAFARASVAPPETETAPANAPRSPTVASAVTMSAPAPVTALTAAGEAIVALAPSATSSETISSGSAASGSG